MAHGEKNKSSEALDRLIREVSIGLIPLQGHCMITTAEAEKSFSDAQFSEFAELGMNKQQMIAATGLCRKTIYNRLKKQPNDLQNNKVAEFLKRWWNSRLFPKVVQFAGPYNWEDLVEAYGKGFKPNSLIEILETYNVISIGEQSVEILTDEVIGKTKPDLIDAGTLAIKELIKTVTHNSTTDDQTSLLRQVLTWHEIHPDDLEDVQKTLSLMTSAYIRSCERFLADKAREADKLNLPRSVKVGVSAHLLQPQNLKS
jgi:predicted DNA-binding transcriptional regulator AlpA